MEPIPELSDGEDDLIPMGNKKSNIESTYVKCDNTWRNFFSIIGLYMAFYAVLSAIFILLFLGALIDSSGNTPDMTGSVSRVCLWIYFYVGILFGLVFLIFMSCKH